MKLTQATFRKSVRDTIKDQNGSFHGIEADVSLTVEAEDGKIEEELIIGKLNLLLEQTRSGDPAWIINREDKKNDK